MFSRTTMASSISNPMQSESAISVSALSVKPKAYSAMKVATTEIGSVSAVITVLRHDARNRKTMMTVSTPPSMMVRLTPSTLAFTYFDWSERMVSSMSLGRSFFKRSIAALTPTPTSTVLLPRTLSMSRLIARTPSMRAKLVCSLLPSTMVATSPSRTCRPSRRATTRLAKSDTCLKRASTRTDLSFWPIVMLPTGASILSLRSAASNWSTPMRRARSLATSGSIWISRVEEPLILTVATPVTFSMRRRMTSSTMYDRSGSVRVFEVTPSDTTARSSSRFACETKGSLASFGKPGRICASLSRISCIATLMSVPIANSTITRLEFSREREVIFLTPAIVFSAFSIGLVRSFSTACGLAPGYCTTVKANGRFTSGIASIGSRK